MLVATAASSHPEARAEARAEALGTGGALWHLFRMLPQRFVILAQPRTGSTYLCDLLSSHPQIVCRGELLRPRRQHHETAAVAVAAHDPRWLDPRYRSANWRAFLDLAFDRPAPFQGFKLFPGQNDEALAALLRDPGWRVIVLHRRNEVAAFASHLTPRATREGHLRGRQEPMDYKPTWCAAQFDRFLHRRREERRRLCGILRAAKRDALTIEYRQISDRDTQRRILDFLGATPNIALYSDMKKRGASDIRSRFANPESLCAPAKWHVE